MTNICLQIKCFSSIELFACIIQLKSKQARIKVQLFVTGKDKQKIIRTFTFWSCLELFIIVILLLKITLIFSTIATCFCSFTSMTVITSYILCSLCANHVHKVKVIVVGVLNKITVLKRWGSQWGKKVGFNILWGSSFNQWWLYQGYFTCLLKCKMSRYMNSWITLIDMSTMGVLPDQSVSSKPWNTSHSDEGASPSIKEIKHWLTHP